MLEQNNQGAKTFWKSFVATFEISTNAHAIDPSNNQLTGSFYNDVDWIAMDQSEGSITLKSMQDSTHSNHQFVQCC